MTAAPAPSRPLSPRDGKLDAVRGMAILAVVGTHSLSATVAVTGSYQIPPAMFRLFDYGQFGVPLFFALSGWLLFYLYDGQSDFSARVYWSRRIARIWPLWALFVVVFYLVWGAPTAGMPMWWGLVLNLLFLGWWSANLVAVPLGGLTIQQEIGHYVLFALFRRRTAAFFASTVIVGYLSMWLALAVPTNVPQGSLAADIAEAWLRLALFTSWPFFLLGGGALVIYRAWRGVGFPLRRMKPGTAVLVSLAIVMALLTTYSQETPFYFVLGYVISLAVLAVALNTVPLVGRLLQSVGRYSYFMYFAHFLVLRWLEAFYRWVELPTDESLNAASNVMVLLAFFILAAGISWALGWVSWRVVEAPIMNWTRQRIRF